MNKGKESIEKEKQIGHCICDDEEEEETQSDAHISECCIQWGPLTQSIVIDSAKETLPSLSAYM